MRVSKTMPGLSVQGFIIMPNIMAPREKPVISFSLIFLAVAFTDSTSKTTTRLNNKAAL